MPSRGVPEPPPGRLRRLHRVWPDSGGNISYLLTICVDGRERVLNDQTTFERFVAFLLDSPKRYGWFGRRFVLMPDHIHLIAHMGHNAVRLGQWVKALKAVVGGIERQEDSDANAGRAPLQGVPVGRVPPRGGNAGLRSSTGTHPHEFTRVGRAWKWQKSFHDHKFRTRESESRKWEYVCLNPVRYGLVERPEDWPFGGEIFFVETGGPIFVRGTPPLLESGMLVEEAAPDTEQKTPRGGTRPTT